MARSLKSVDQALALMEHLAHAADPQTVTGLSQEFGLSKATVHRILATLRARGYVVQDPVTSRYSFGLTPARLVQEAGDAETLTAACSQAMRWLRRKTGETVLLTVRDGDKAVVVEKLDSTQPVLSTNPQGRLMPLHAVSSGMALLANMPDEEIRAILAESCMVQYTQHSLLTYQAVWRQIRSVRIKGYAINREYFRDGVSGVAAPVRAAHRARPVAAIAVCVPSSRFEPRVDDLCSSVVQAALRASETVQSGTGAIVMPGPWRDGEQSEPSSRVQASGSTAPLALLAGVPAGLGHSSEQ